MQLFTPSLENLDKCTELYDGKYLIDHFAYYDEYDKLLNNKNFKKFLLLGILEIKLYLEFIIFIFIKIHFQFYKIYLFIN